MDSETLTEVPSSLKRLARMVVRGFYGIEHVIIIDMLVRNPCMKEDDLADLLKFEKKQLRSCIAQLKNDKFIKVRLKMETGPDGKATRQNYYFINYKIFVNVVKYKLDHMRRKIETEERDSTSRASFKCPQCLKSFTDLEVNLLFDMVTNEFRCTFCNSIVEEDESSLPKQDSRLLLAKFNEQIEPMYVLLRDVEDIKLAPEILEPEPTDLSGLRDNKARPSAASRQFDKGVWSGDATRHRDYNLDQDVTVNIGDETQAVASAQTKKERPIWMVESTVVDAPPKVEVPAWGGSSSFKEDVTNSIANREQEDIMQVLLAHEKKGANAATGPIIPKSTSDNETDTSESEDEAASMPKITRLMAPEPEVGEMEDDDDDDDAPMVTVGSVQVPLHAVTDELINKMTVAEKETYIRLSQEMYARMYE